MYTHILLFVFFLSVQCYTQKYTCSTLNYVLELAIYCIIVLGSKAHETASWNYTFLGYMPIGISFSQNGAQNTP